MIGEDGVATVEGMKYTDIVGEKEKLFDAPENASLFDSGIMAISHAGWDAIAEETSEAPGCIDTPVLKEKSPAAAAQATGSPD